MIELDKGEFKLIVNGKLMTYHRYSDIPKKFDNVISFKPKYPEGPHTMDEHDLIMMWNEKLQRLMEIERASSN